MKKMIFSCLVLTIACALTLAAAPRQGQGDAMKSDSMNKDQMSQDSMSKDKMAKHGMSESMAKAKVLKGWVSDLECAAKGDKKCSNKDHVAQGAKLVIVTDGDNKVWTVSNPEKLADHQGHHVQVKARTDSAMGTVTVQEVKMLKEGK